jgi:hypothetical protein
MVVDEFSNNSLITIKKHCHTPTNDSCALSIDTVDLCLAGRKSCTYCCAEDECNVLPRDTRMIVTRSMSVTQADAEADGEFDGSWSTNVDDECVDAEPPVFLNCPTADIVVEHAGPIFSRPINLPVLQVFEIHVDS